MLMITCLTSLTGLIFCTLFSILYSYFQSNQRPWSASTMQTQLPFIRLLHSPRVLAKWRKWRNSYKAALEALLQTLQQFYHALMSNSAFSFAPIFTLAISAHIHRSYVFPILFQILIAQHPHAQRRGCFSPRRFFEWCFSFKKNQTKTTKQVNLNPSFPQGCIIILMGELHANNLVHMKLPSSITVFSCPTFRKIQ